MAGAFSPATLEQIRAASDIVEVVGSYIPLKRAGANFVALCPFHKERSPSFNVNAHRQIFHCFGCHKGGDVFRFVQDYENLSFPEAVRRLAERARIPLEVDTQPGQPEARQRKEILWQIHEQITARWHTVLLNDSAGESGREYLLKRGVSPEAIKLFRLGFAPAAWDDTVNWARSKGHDLATVEEAGLVIRKEGEERYYDRFRGRLMFPICDDQSRVVGFSGRVIAGDEKTAKYVNSPETPIFTKGRVIFGLDKSKRALLDAGAAIICEGQLDLIACFMAGVQNVVAPQGTALTADHARILKRYVNEVVLCFDSDTAGQKAAVRALDDLLSAGLAIRVATLPAPHDPDSFIKEFGAEAFRSLINGSRGFFDFYLDQLCATNDVTTDRGRITLARSMAEALRKTGSAILMDTYMRKTAHRLGVSVEAVRAEFKSHKTAPQRADTAFEALTANAPAFSRPPLKEFWLLRLLFIRDDTLTTVLGRLDPAWLQHAGARELVTRRLQAESENSWRGMPAFLDTIEDAGLQSLLTEAVSEPRLIPSPEHQLIDTCLRLRNEHFDRQIAALMSRVADSSISDTERNEAVSRQTQLRQLKQTPL